MVYPGAGIAVSTGSAWGTSLTDNSSNWNTAYGWGNHASGGYLTSATAATTYASLTGSYANPSWITSLAYSKITGVPAFLTSYTETDPYRVTSVAVTGTSTKTITLTRADASTVTTTWTDIDTDTNTYATSLGFSAGTLTLTNNNATTVTVSLDGRYYLASNPNSYISSYTETDTLATVTARGASTSTQITFSGAGDNSTTYSSVRFAGYNQGGGVGYYGFFEIQNTYGSVTNGKKFFRMDGAGTLQIINSAYTTNIFNLSDAGALTVQSIIKSGGTSSQILMADGSVLTAGTNITISGGTISSSGGSGGVSSFNTRTGAITLTSADVTTAG